MRILLCKTRKSIFNRYLLPVIMVTCWSEQLFTCNQLVQLTTEVIILIQYLGKQGTQWYTMQVHHTCITPEDPVYCISDPRFRKCYYCRPDIDTFFYASLQKRIRWIYMQKVWKVSEEIALTATQNVFSYLIINLNDRVCYITLSGYLKYMDQCGTSCN